MAGKRRKATFLDAVSRPGHCSESPPCLTAFLRLGLRSPSRSGHWDVGGRVSLMHLLALDSRARALWVKHARFMDESGGAYPPNVGCFFHRPQQSKPGRKGPRSLCSPPPFSSTHHSVRSSHHPSNHLLPRLGHPNPLDVGLRLWSEAYPPTSGPADQGSCWHNSGPCCKSSLDCSLSPSTRISCPPLQRNGGCRAVHTSGASGHAKKGCPVLLLLDGARNCTYCTIVVL